MNKILVLQIGVLVSFSSMNGMMNIVKGLCGKDRTYSCALSVEDSVHPSSITFSGIPCVGPGQCVASFKYDENSIWIGRRANSRTDTLKIEDKEAKDDLMKKLANHLTVRVSYMHKGQVKTVDFINTPHTDAKAWALKSYADQSSNCFKSTNKDLNNVTIESDICTPEQSDDVALLQVPSVWNPRGSLSIRALNRKDFSIDETFAESLLGYSMLSQQITTKDHIKISYNDSNLSKSIFLYRHETKEQLLLYLSELKKRNRVLFGLSFAALVAVLTYLKFNQK